MTTLSFVTLNLIAACIGGDAGSWKLPAKFGVGQELTYVGTITHRAVEQDGVVYEQPYELEASMLVFDVNPLEVVEVGCTTNICLPGCKRLLDGSTVDPAMLLRFDLVNVNEKNSARWAMNEADVAYPPDGIVPWELGYFMEVPTRSVGVGDGWTIRSAGQPQIRCRVLGTENIGGVECCRVDTVQESSNWMDKTGNLPAWKITTETWRQVKGGFVAKIHRVHEVRQPGMEKATKSVTTDYQLVTTLRYGGTQFEERVADFRAAYKAQSDLEIGLAGTDRNPASRFQAIRDQLKIELDRPSASPYRPAMNRLKNLAEIAIQSPQRAKDSTLSIGKLQGSAAGKKAASFNFSDLESSERYSMKKLAGKSFVLVLGDPSTNLMSQALQSVLKAVDLQKKDVTVMAICTTGDVEMAKVFREKVKGNYRLCSGAAMDRSYGIDTYPFTIFVDSDGFVRASIPGLGPENYSTLCDCIGKYNTTIMNLGQKKIEGGSMIR